MILIRNMVTQPDQLKWWQWGQVWGVMLPVLLISAGVYHPLLWAVALHLFMDFTAQSDETAAGKRQGDMRVLLYHSFISGGYAGFIAGGMPGLLVSIVVHFLIDSANKFGFTGLTGAVLDQAAHIITIVTIFLLLQSYSPISFT